MLFKSLLHVFLPVRRHLPLIDSSKSLEQKRFEADEEHRRLERQREDRKLGFWHIAKSTGATLVGPLSAAVIAFGGSVVVGDLNSRAALQVEKRKDQSDLIVQALTGRDHKQTIIALEFLAKAGMIPDYQEKVLALARDNEGLAVPASPAPSSFIQRVPPTDREQLYFVIDSSKTGRMKLPSGVICTPFKPLTMLFTPKNGMPITCQAIITSDDSLPNFDLETFKHDHPNVIPPVATKTP